MTTDTKGIYILAETLQDVYENSCDFLDVLGGWENTMITQIHATFDDVGNCKKDGISGLREKTSGASSMTSVLDILSLPDDQAAPAITARMRQTDRTLEVAFTDMGLMIREVRDRRLWKLVIDRRTELPHLSFESWVCCSAPYSRTYCFEGMRIVDELAKDIPLESLSGLRECNARELMRVSSTVRRDPEVLKLAHTAADACQLADEINSLHPTQHLEHLRLVRLRFPESDFGTVSESVERVMDREGLKSWEDVLMYWATNELLS